MNIIDDDIYAITSLLWFCGICAVSLYLTSLVTYGPSMQEIVKIDG